MREVVWVGIDVGKAHHHACAVDAAGKTVFSRRVLNGQAEIEALIARASKAAAQVRWAMDMTSSGAGLLTTLLLAAGQADIREMQRYLDGLTWLGELLSFRAVDTTKAFLGSYDLSWQVVGRTTAGTVVQFNLTNVSNITSATTDPSKPYPTNPSAASLETSLPGERFQYQSVLWREVIP